MRLEAFAERFRAAGYACLVFDYRHFGASGGSPRQLIDIGRQLEDWAAAIGYVRDLPVIDCTRVILWGTSFSGGHVLATAARDLRVQAVISQNPFTDGVASVRAIPISTTLRLTARALRDAIGSWFGRPPVMVPLAGRPGDTALMTAPDVWDGYTRLRPPGQPGRNFVAARIGLAIGLYRPGRLVRHIGCPVLFGICLPDSVAPARAALRHARRALLGEVRTYACGHFDIYVGEAFERAIADQIAFLNAHIPVSSRYGA
jgi:pimeloyl-ACP methyl ester carboxylesterase